MAFVIYEVSNTKLYGGYENHYKTERAAKAAVTRAVNRGEINRNEFAIADKAFFHQQIEKKVERTNLISGEKYMEAINTPSHLSPAYERYWCM